MRHRFPEFYAALDRMDKFAKDLHEINRRARDAEGRKRKQDKELDTIRQNSIDAKVRKSLYVRPSKKAPV